MISGSKRVAIVTGSGQGIGRAIALRLANDGYDVALFDLPNNGAHLETLKTEISKEFGTKAISVLGDVTKERDVEVLIEDTVQKLGSLDVVRTATVGTQLVIHRMSSDDSKRRNNISRLGN